MVELLDDDDRDELLDTLVELTKDKPMYDPWKAYEYLTECANLRMVGGYCVGYALVTPWFSSVPMLTELVVIRLRAGGTLTDVTDFLTATAENFGAQFVGVGTMLADNNEALSRMYQKRGFAVAGHQLIKEVGPCA